MLEVNNDNDVSLKEYFDLTSKYIDGKFVEVDDRFKDVDVKYQIQFNAAKEALGIALIAQEKAVAAALDSTKEAIGKAEIATDKRFDLLSEKIDGVNEMLNKNAGAQGIYVTHSDLTVIVDKIQTGFNDALRPLISQVNVLTAAQNTAQGQGKGVSMSWGVMIAAIGGFGTLIAIFFALNK